MSQMDWHTSKEKTPHFQRRGCGSDPLSGSEDPTAAKRS